jgi:hypothetical protein
MTTTQFDPGLQAFYTQQFSTNLELLLQQRVSLLRGTTMEGFHVGMAASPINQVGPLAMQAPAGIYAPAPVQQAALQRRWVMPTFKEGFQLVDTFEELQTVVDPKSAFVETFAAAVGRAWDDSIIAAATGTAMVGQNAAQTTNVAFSNTNFQISASFGAGSAVGLTLAKIAEARRILRHYHNDLERDQPTLVIGSKQESDLANQVQLVNELYEENLDVKHDANGKIQRILGMNVVISERLPQTTVNTTRGVLLYVRSGIHLGIWKDLENNIDQRVDLSGRPWQVRTAVGFGATRLQEGKVVQILCADTTGADITP